MKWKHLKTFYSLCFFLLLLSLLFSQNVVSGKYHEAQDSGTEATDSGTEAEFCIKKKNLKPVFALKRLASKVKTFIDAYVVPKTDENCTWLWSHWRCEPQCECAIKYKFGDYSPSRACRKKHYEMDPGCDPFEGDDTCLSEKFASFVMKHLKRAHKFIMTHVVPQTDDQCTFSLKQSLKQRRPVCQPQPSCSFQFKLGDYHLGRACRLKTATHEPTSFYESLFAEYD